MRLLNWFNALFDSIPLNIPAHFCCFIRYKTVRIYSSVRSFVFFFFFSHLLLWGKRCSAVFCFSFRLLIRYRIPLLLLLICTTVQHICNCRRKFCKSSKWFQYKFRFILLLIVRWNSTLIDSIVFHFYFMMILMGFFLQNDLYSDFHVVFFYTNNNKSQMCNTIPLNEDILSKIAVLSLCVCVEKQNGFVWQRKRE